MYRCPFTTEILPAKRARLELRCIVVRAFWFLSPPPQNRDFDLDWVLKVCMRKNRTFCYFPSCDIFVALYVLYESMGRLTYYQMKDFAAIFWLPLSFSVRSAVISLLYPELAWSSSEEVCVDYVIYYYLMPGASKCPIFYVHKTHSFWNWDFLWNKSMYYEQKILLGILFFILVHRKRLLWKLFAIFRRKKVGRAF